MINDNTGDRLSFTLFLAVALHVIVLYSVGFSTEKGNTVAPVLNITLATHDAKRAPEKADFLAAFNQEASGTEDETKELTVEKLADIQDVAIRDINPVPQQKASQQHVVESRVITSTESSTQKTTVKQNRDQQDERQEHEGELIDTPLIDPEIASLRATLDKQRQALAKMPRIRRLHSTSTKASHEAAYLLKIGQEIERVGQRNFPEAALRDNILGKLILRINILPNGAVETIEIVKPSGYAVLDEAAIQIVRLASPFPPLPREIRQDWDKLEVYRAMLFEIDGMVSTF